ncbi:aryl-sulfate sulfotransferase [Algibacter mikhailovii]|uniref:Thioredoxin n=1 Tax=Algibacter mikhailovii TaxID=425498 RepID=A0A918VAU7_9FLAO|nr:aryl-sulfate sulfotransferase [Algibacter mikhailovii]GGZ86077.1 thioredoxin [Algibacter mikhailovii]
MKNIRLFILFFLINCCFTIGQNTVGILSNTANSFVGYTLFTSQKETYLIDNCGRVINQWTSQYNPGNAVYLLENGDLLRAAKISNDYINFGGTGGRVEKFDWDGNLIWEFEYNDQNKRLHHDIYPMPNGNVLLLAVTVIDNADAIEAGRDPNNLVGIDLYNEKIFEVEPIGNSGGNIVWEWNIMDHLIQDFDDTKSNFGEVSKHPELLDINYLGNSAGKANWLHFNSIQYNDALNQIVISSRLMSEIYIIDHSTTTNESSNHTGGNYGKGGDFLYRWGNPQVYNHGTEEDRQLFGQHFPYIIPNGLPDAGKIILFNNGYTRTPDFSQIFKLSLPAISPGIYSYDSNFPYGPLVPDFIYTNPIDPSLFSAGFVSGAQQLPNGNILICNGPIGNLFEVDTSGKTVWEYINPSTKNGVWEQGIRFDPYTDTNTVFRATRYALDYLAFEGKTLIPGNTIETGSSNYNCQLLSANRNDFKNITIYPNPVEHNLHLKSIKTIRKVEIYDIFGKLVKTYNANNIKTLNVSYLKTGIYLMKLYDGLNYSINERFVKK